MAKSTSPAVMTANDLLSGDTVWWTGTGWSREIGEALVAVNPEEIDALGGLAGSPTHEADVVGPYLVDVTLADGAPFPRVRREAIRAERAPTFAYAPEPLADAA